MSTYTITEKQNGQSQREGYTVELKDLTAAKRHASKNQAFQGTYISIEENGITVAAKERDGKWVAESYFNS